MKLYYVQHTRSVRARWMLEELGLPYELHRVNVAEKEHKTQAYRQHIHPLGHVPALEDGGVTLFESAAIVAHLADRHPEKGLAPRPGTLERGQYYQWMFFAMHELDAWLARIAEHTRFFPEDRRIPALVDEAKAHASEALAVVEAHLGGRPYVLGSEFSAADILMSGVVLFARFLGLLEGSPNLQAYLARTTARPAFQRATAD